MSLLSLRPELPTKRYPNNIVRLIVIACFFLIAAATVFLTKLTLVLPVRSILSIILIVVLGVVSPRRFTKAVFRQRQCIGLAAFFALVGSTLAILNGGELAPVMQAAVEIHAQSIVIVVLVALVAEWCGSRAVIKVFLLTIAITSFFAVGQFFNIPAFWEASKALQSLQNAAPLPFDEVNRPLGISFSQTVFSGQICLALTGYLLLKVRFQGGAVKPALSASHLMIGVAGLCLIAVFSGNRSPILGGAVLTAVYLATYRSTFFILLVPVFLLAGFIVEPVLTAAQDAGLRVAETGDTSSVGRLTLIRYGLLLFIDNPLGYGTLFNSVELWRPYYGYLAQYPGVDLITFVPLHNYIVSMMNIYGITFLLVLPLVGYYLCRYGLITLLFAPYMTHCFFHNSGPFYNEIYLWFVLSAVPVLRAELFYRAPPSRADRPDP